jgi:transcriptional regulator with XRE-family HTH domain
MTNANQLRRIRLERGVTQVQLAAMTGLRQPLISQLETATVNPSYRVAQRVADALGVQPRDLFGDPNAASAA